MLKLPAPLRSELAAFARSAHPDEACGVLVGRSTDGSAEVRRVVRCPNAAAGRTRDRYELDPAALMRADHAARAEGLEIVGIWHSHPDHPARPSETDRAQAWEGWSYLILSVSVAGVGDLRSWRLKDGAFHEEPMEEPMGLGELVRS